MNKIKKNQFFTTTALMLTITACSDDVSQAQRNSVITANNNYAYQETQDTRSPVAAETPFQTSNENNDTQYHPSNDVANDHQSTDDEAELDNYYYETPYAYVTPAPDRVSLVTNSEGYIQWTPPTEVYYQQAEVTLVSANGERIQQSYTSGEPIIIDDQLPDGVYKWEAVIVPEINPYAREQLAALRQSGDTVREQALLQQFRADGSFPSQQELNNNRQSGSLSIRNGIATPVGPDTGNSQHEG